MDNFKTVSEILTAWGFPELSDVFEENDIDLEAFILLEAEHIKEFIGKVGPRLKFLKKLKDYKEKLSNQEEVDSNNTSFNTSTASTVTINSDEGAHQDFADALGLSPSHNLYLDPVTGQRIVHTVEESAQFENINNVSAPWQIKPEKQIDKKCDVSPLAVNNQSTPSATITFKDIRREEFEKFLKSSSEWPIIQKKSTDFDEYTRGKIGKVGLDFLLTRYPPKKIPHKAFAELSEVISEIFPKESAAIYFTPYKPETESSPSLLAGGKLFSKYNNYKRLINQIECGPKLKKVKGSQKEELIDSPSNDVVVATEFLKHNIGPENEITIYWDATFQSRRNSLQKTDIHSYFTTYPALQQPFGYNLLLQDYEKLHPKSINEIYSTWSKLSQAILILAKKKNIINEEYYNTCNKEIAAIKYLPALFSTSTVRHGRKNWRPSKAEMQESFLLHLNNVGLLHETIERRKATLLSKKETLQPFMVLIEENTSQVSYVVINNSLYLIETPLKALDVCFKTFFALDCKYPVECQQVWTFIESFVYNLKVEKRYAGLNVITNEINNILQEMQ